MFLLSALIIIIGIVIIISSIEMKSHNNQPKQSLSPTEKKPKLTPQKQLRGEFGALKVNLQWSTKDDLDIHIIDPCKNEVYYQKKECYCQDSLGRLDIDANSSELNRTPQENIFWEKNPPTGEYIVYVDFYKKHESDLVNFRLTIITKTENLVFETNISSNEKKEVIKFIYDKRNGISIIKGKNIML